MAAIGIPFKALAFGVVATIAGFLMFSGTAKADVPEPPPPPPVKPPVPTPPPPPKPCADGKTGGIVSGVKMTMKTAQAALNRADPTNKLAVDGDYGPNTKAALIAFQTNTKIPATGCLDEATAILLQPYVVDTGGTYVWFETFHDRHGVPYALDRNGAGTVRATRKPFQLANESYVEAYPGEPKVLYAPTRVEIVRAIEFIAQDYEMDKSSYDV